MAGNPSALVKLFRYPMVSKTPRSQQGMNQSIFLRYILNIRVELGGMTGGIPLLP